MEQLEHCSLPHSVGDGRDVRVLFATRRVSGAEANEFGCLLVCLPKDTEDEGVYAVRVVLCLESGGERRCPVVTCADNIEFFCRG